MLIKTSFFFKNALLAHIDEENLDLMLRNVLDASKITKNLVAGLFSEYSNRIVPSSTLTGNPKNKDNLPNVLAADKVTLIENYVIARFPLTTRSKVRKSIGEKLCDFRKSKS